VATFSPKRLLWASRIAVLVLAAASAYFVLLSLRTMWAPVGDFGLGIDQATAVIDELDPRDAAKGFRLGDRIDLAAMPFSERGYLYENLVDPIGLGITVTAGRPGSTRSETLETVAFDDFGVDEAYAGFARKIVAMVYILVAVILVWGRPNLMLWGLAVFLLRTHYFLIGDLRSPPVAALIILSSSVISALGWPGLIVFLARFPENRTTRMTKYWDAFAAVYFLFGLFVQLHDYLPLFTARPIPDLPSWTSRSEFVIAVAVFVALCSKVLRATGRSQWRGFRWVVLGYGVGILLGWNIELIWNVIPNFSNWAAFGGELLMLTFPASVAYAVVRHRAFGLGFLANRILVSGAFFIGIVSTIVVSVWTASHATSTLGLGFAMFVALLVGMNLRSSPAIVGRFVDRVFLRRRYETLASLDTIRHTLRSSDDPKRLTEEIATTLGLASLAVFSRTGDGGFVRNAAFGWPAGSAWHLLPEEPLTRTLDGGGTAIVRVPDERDDELALPADDARPQFALAVRRGDRVERAIFVGPQRNGASLDRDAMRSLQGVFRDASFA
jgi:hypothetical protein